MPPRTFQTQRKTDECYTTTTTSDLVCVTESYSMSSEDESPGKESQTSTTMASSKPTLSDIYERSEEGESDKNKTTLTGTLSSI